MSYRFFFLLGLLLLCCDLSAQSKSNEQLIDSLTLLLANDKSLNEQRVDRLNALGYEYWIVDPAVSIDLGSEALEIARILPYPTGLAFANRVIGVAHWARGNMELSFEYLLLAERAYQETGDDLGLANSRLNLGMTYADQQQGALAQKKYEEALAIFEDQGASSRVATTYTKMADLLIEQGDLEPAFTYLRKALRIHEENKFLYGIAEANGKLGKLATVNGDYSEAISYFLLGVESGNRRNDHVGQAESYYGIGNAYLQKEDYVQASEYLNKARLVAERYGLQRVRRDIYEACKNLEVARKNYAAAIGYYDQYLMVKDSLFNAEKSNIITNLESQRAYAEKQQELALSQKNLELLVQKNKTNRLTGFALVMGLLAIVGVGWGVIRNRNRVLAEKQRDLHQARVKTDALENTIRSNDQELTSYTLNFVQKNKLISELREELNGVKQEVPKDHRSKLESIGRKLDAVLNVDRDWADFRRHFESVHPKLIGRLYEDFPALTKNEFRLIALLRLNLSSKEMGAILGISSGSVKTARYRLRKKLKLESQDDLFSFLLKYS